MTTINERFRAIRKQLGMTMEEFGKSLGGSRDVIKNIEYNVTQPKPPLIDLLCKVHQVDRDWLMTGEGEMFIKPANETERLLLFATRMTTEKDLSWLRTLCDYVAQLSPEELEAAAKFISTLSHKVVENEKKEQEN